MARLKVKQIEDFTSAVDGLISAATADETASINSLESVDSVQNLSIDALQDDAADAIASINSLEGVASGNNTVNEASIDSLESVDSVQNLSIDSLDTLANANDASIEAILSGTSVDLDQFVEIVNFVDSMDTVNDNLLSDFIAVANGSIDSLESVDSIQNVSIDSLESDIADLQTADTRLHQFGTVATTTSFTIPLQVDVSATADTLVFINGHNIHVEDEGIDGWTSPNGTTFNLAGIGYDIDAEDHIYVVAPRA